MIQALDDSIANVVGPVCIVSRRKVEAVNQWVVGRLAQMETSSSAPPVTADGLKDVAPWIAKQDGPVTVLAYLSLWERSSNRAALVELKESAMVESRLIFLEPTVGVGLASIFQRFAKPMLRRRIGLSFHRDIPAMVRAAGWQLTTVNRVSVGAPAGVMTFVAGEARIYE